MWCAFSSIDSLICVYVTITMWYAFIIQKYVCGDNNDIAR